MDIQAYLDQEVAPCQELRLRLGKPQMLEERHREALVNGQCLKRRTAGTESSWARTSIWVVGHTCCLMYDDQCFAS